MENGNSMLTIYMTNIVGYIPQLVDEKIKYYFYRERWKDVIKKVNNEYFSAFLVLYSDENPYYFVLERRIDMLRNICYIPNYRYNFRNLIFHDNTPITSFLQNTRKFTRGQSKLPKRYFYTGYYPNSLAGSSNIIL
tara:strand:- start:3861 stop:4268 length:408 start_codon:yes stop_codon:yes gene_type:complete